MAWREDGTGYGSYPVSALIRPPSRVIWQLTLLDAQGNIETFETTDDHPWHVKGGHVSEGHDGAAGNRGNFLRTDELAAGMEISTQDGDGVSVIEVIKTTERAPTYNLTVADAHTFFVGNDGIWVHNTDCFKRRGNGEFSNHELEADFQRTNAEAEINGYQPQTREQFQARRTVGDGEGLSHENFDFHKGNDGRNVDYTNNPDLSFDDALDEAFRRTGVPRDQFTPIRDSNGNITKWSGPNGAEVNLDVPTANSNGPRAPHIGYTTPGRNRSRGDGIVGHIFPAGGVPFGRSPPSRN